MDTICEKLLRFKFNYFLEFVPVLNKIKNEDFSCGFCKRLP